MWQMSVVVGDEKVVLVSCVLVWNLPSISVYAGRLLHRLLHCCCHLGNCDTVLLLQLPGSGTGIHAVMTEKKC